MKMKLAAILIITAVLSGCGDPCYQEQQPYQGKLHPPIQGTYSTGDIPYK